MKILREKIFFDYKKYAEKYGEDAANEMRIKRGNLAKEVFDMRKLDKGIKLTNKELLSAFPNYPNDLPRTDMAEKTLQSGKKQLKIVENSHIRQKQHKKVMDNIDEEFKNKLNSPLLSKKAKIGLGIGLGVATIGGGLGYAAYKRRKNKKKEED